MEIQEAIKEIRLNKSLNQQALAEALHCDTAVVSNIETGKRDVKFKELEIISKFFKMSLIDLITYPDKYVKKTQKEEDTVEAILQIKLRKDKRDQVLRLVFSDDDLEILNQP